VPTERWIYLASFALSVNLAVNYWTHEVALHDHRSSEGHVPVPSSLAHILGGFFVGVGTKIGNGCTTGHGICGIGRFSPRSLAAVTTFTGMSILTTFLVAPGRSWSNFTNWLRTDKLPEVSPLASALITGGLCWIAMTRPVHQADETDSRKTFGAAVSGALFATGLAVSGMTKNSKVHDFLCFSNIATDLFDPTLMAVMIAGIGSSWLSYQFVTGYSSLDGLAQECPVALPQGSTFSVPASRVIDGRLLIGTTIFGFGWYVYMSLGKSTLVFFKELDRSTTTNAGD